MKSRFENFITKKPNTEEDHSSIERNTTPEARESIERIQASKEELAQKLKDWRGKFFGESVDSDLESEYGNRTLRWNGTTYETYLKGGQKIELTRGEVLSAGEWGTFWAFDQSVDKHDQQGIMSHQVRTLIGGMYDEQLVEFGRVNKLSDDRKRDTYERIAERPEELDRLGDGLLAEKMIGALLLKAQHDYKLPFRLQRIDVYEDVENKIDFIVELPQHRRGVGVSEQSSEIGVQFTLNQSKTDTKQEQIRQSKIRGESSVDDIVLVSMPLHEIRSLFEQWRYDNKGNKINEKRLDPRGPNMLMNDEFVYKILHAIFKALPLNINETELRERIAGSQEHSLELQRAA